MIDINIMYKIIFCLKTCFANFKYHEEIEKNFKYEDKSIILHNAFIKFVRRLLNICFCTFCNIIYSICNTVNP